MVQLFEVPQQAIIILIAGILGAKVAERFKVPIIIPLLISGYIAGPEILGIFAPLKLGLSLEAITSLAIPVILFEEGMHIDIALLKKFKVTILLLATLAVVVSTVGIGLIANLAFGWQLFPALLLGSILAATDPGATIAILEQLTSQEKISTILKVEASLNDATSIVLFTIISGMILGNTVSIPFAVLSFIRLFFGGLAVGLLISLLVVFVAVKLELQKYSLYLSIIVFLTVYSASLLLDVSVAAAMVSAGLALGPIMGRLKLSLKTEKVVSSWSDLTFLAQSVIFIVLGAGFSIGVISPVWLPAIIMALLLFVLVRPFSVFTSTCFEKNLTRNEKAFLSWIGARGAVPAALAASAVALGISEGVQIFGTILVIVLVSLIITSFTSNIVAKKLLKPNSEITRENQNSISKK
jgi:potassium/hydrogen antiporter